MLTLWKTVSAPSAPEENEFGWAAETSWRPFLSNNFIGKTAMILDDWEQPTHCSIIRHRPTGITFYLYWDLETGKTTTCSRARNCPPEYVERLKVEAAEAYDAYESQANS